MADVFRPRLPIDPFAALDTPNPWQLHPLPPQILPPRHIVLVLGAPTYTDLAPLASSPHLSSSLLILATHTPPPLDRPPSHTGPSILILHLPAPLAVHDAGAVRLVSLLERAQRAAAVWAAAPAPRIQQLGEDGPDGEFVVPEEPEVSQQRHAPRSPAVPNPSPLNPYATGSTSPASSFSSLAYTLPHSKPKRSSLKPKNRHSAPMLFTTLLSFLPSGLPEKSLLKHAILVTTLSAPFLSTTASAHPPVPVLVPSSLSSTSSLPRSSPRSILAALPFSSLSLPASAHPHPRRRSRLSSLFSASSHRLIPPAAPSVDSLPPRAHTPPPACKPHLVHVLPYSATQPLTKHRPHSLSHHLAIPGPASPGAGSSLGHTRASIGIATQVQTRGKTKLVQSIEQFLLSFAYPLGLPSLASREGSVRTSVAASGSGLGLGSGLRGSRTAPSSPSHTAPPSPVRTSPAHGLPPPLLPPSAYPKSQSTSALAGPATAPAVPHQARTPSSASSHKARTPSSSASSVSSSAHPRSRPASTYSTYSTISGISAFSGSDGEAGGGGKGRGVAPYLVPAGVMGGVVLDSKEEGRGVSLSVGEAMVLGLLDGAAAGEGWPRAWIGDAGEVVWGEEGEGYEHELGEGRGDELEGSVAASGRGGGNGKGKEREEGSDDQSNRNLSQKREREREGKSKSKSKRRVRRNEAGLPTPPESSSSLDSASESEEGDGYVRVRRGSGFGFGEEVGSGSGLGLGLGEEGLREGVMFPMGMGMGGEREGVSVEDVGGRRLGLEVERGNGETGKGKKKGKKTLGTRVSSFFGRSRRGDRESGGGGGVEREGLKGLRERDGGKVLTRKVWGRG